MHTNRGFGQLAPVNEGDEIEVKIETVGKKGDGIAKRDGFVLFVPNTKEGDEVKIKITRVLRNVGFAEVIGKAEGSVEQQTKEEEPAEAGKTQTEPEQTHQESASEESEDKSQDTEDFGEELEETK